MMRYPVALARFVALDFGDAHVGFKNGKLADPGFFFSGVGGNWPV